MGKQETIDRAIAAIYKELVFANGNSNMVDPDSLPDKILSAHLSLTMIEVTKNFAITSPELGFVYTPAQRRLELRYMCLMLRRAQRLFALAALDRWTTG